MEDNDDSLKSDLDCEYVPLSTSDQYKSSYKEMFNAPRELYLIFIIKLTVIGGIHTFLIGLPTYLSDVEDLSDYGISLFYGSLGLASLMCIITASPIPDRYGIKFSLILSAASFIICMIILLTLKLSVLKDLLVIIILPFSIVLGGVSLDIGMKHYTNFNYRLLALSFFSIVGYLAQIFGGLLLEICLNTINSKRQAFNVIFIYCGVVCIIGLIVCCFIRKLDVSAYIQKELEIKKPKHSFYDHMRQVMCLKKFWRVLFLSIIILMIKMIFFQQNLFLPIYMDRDLGNDSHYGMMIILNQVIVILTLPVFSYLNYYISNYSVFIFAGFFAVLSTIPFLFGSSYLNITLFIVISSISESLFGPRVLDYCLEISPKGREGVMFSLIVLPSLIGNLLTGVLTGILLANFCPEDGERSCWIIWAIFAVIASIGLFLLISLRKYLEEPNFESNPYMPCFKESQES